MLSVRLAVVTAGAGLCLWGLFSLLDTLKEPALLQSSKAIVIKGCNSVADAVVHGRCQQLRCQKAMLERKLVPRRAQFEISVTREHQQQSLIGGLVRSHDQTPLTFACVLDSTKVIEAGLLKPEELVDLAQQTSGWTLTEK